MEKPTHFDKTFLLSDEFRRNIDSINRFATIIEYFRLNDNQSILVDLTKYKYIHPSFAVLIAAMPYIADDTRNKSIIRYKTTDGKCVSFLNNSGILKHYYTNNNTIVKDVKGSVDFKVVISMDASLPTINELMDNIPVKLDSEATDSLISKIYEVFDNSFSHSGKEKVFCCGALDSQHSLVFSIYDLGKGIPESVNDYLQQKGDSKLTSEKALEWALVQGNSVCNGKSDYFRGAGLHLLEEFIKENNGEIIIASADAYCKISHNKKLFGRLDIPLLGTYFSILIRRDKTHRYIKSDIIIKQDI